MYSTVVRFENVRRLLLTRIDLTDDYLIFYFELINTIENIYKMD